MPEEVDRLLGRRDGVVRRVQEQERPGRDLADHVVGPERVHALDHVERKLHDRARRDVAPQGRRNRHDVVARDHDRLARLLAAPALLEHGAESLPGLGRFVLLAEFLLPVAPAAGRDARGDPLVDPRRVDGDRGAEARADHADAIGVDLGPRRQESERAPGVLDLLEADDAAARALALTAAAHVEAERRVAEAGEHLRGGGAVAAVLVAAEAVQDQEGRAPLAGAPAVVGYVQHSRELQPLGHERDALFHGVSSAGRVMVMDPLLPSSPASRYTPAPS